MIRRAESADGLWRPASRRGEEETIHRSRPDRGHRSPGRRPLRGATLLAALLVAGLAAPVSAQTVSFGKNKIQYKDFDWRVLRSEHFDLYYYPEEAELARTALGMAETAYAEVSGRMRHEVTRRVPLIIYATHQDFQETNVSPYFLPEGVAGFTEFIRGRVAMPFNGSYLDFRHTLHHELVHVFQLSRMEELYRLHYRSTLFGTPLWFTEGMAEHWAEAWDSTGDLFLGDMVLHDRVPAIRDLWHLDGTFVLYKVGQDLHGFLERRFGPEIVPEIYDRLWRSPSFEAALSDAAGLPLEKIDALWKQDLRRRYYPRVETREPLMLAARPLAVAGGANFKAAVPPPEAGLGPDTFFFLSPRTGYTNIYRASTRGRERDVAEVVRGQRSPQFESFHAFESRIDVDRRGRLVFVSKFGDRDALFLYDPREETVLGRWQFADLVGLRSPTFSPDGEEAIFAGLSRSGRQDLYRYRFGDADVRPLTDDTWLDDEPAWSPDGRTVAFVSDRGDAPGSGARHLFLLDLEGGGLVPLTAGPHRDRAPAWTADGRRLALSSDRDGTAQIFVVDTDGVGVRVTSVLGGATDPEWLPGDDGILFTGMEDLRFGIWRAAVEACGDTVNLGAGEPAIAAAAPADSAAGTPAPPEGVRGADDRAGPEDREVAAKELPYRSRFSLDFAQGGVAFEPTQNVGEGLQALLSDQLGDRLIFLQLSNTAESFDEFLGRMSFGVTYYDVSRRLNRGISVFHFAGDFLDELGYRYFERRVGAAAIASYPYSRYSRIESSLGLLYSDRQEDSFRRARRGFLAVNYVSLIHDTSLWQPTGPIDGWRGNLTLGLTTNVEQVEIENVAAIVDVRRYFRTGLRTAYAVRVQGRISQGSLPQRFVLGGSWSLRGYPRRSLVGTRSVLVNQEWRFPILTGAAIGLPVGVIGLPPVEGAIFLDGAQAWEEGETPDDIVGSFGLGLRTNFAGIIVLRLDLSRRTDFRRVEPGTDVDFFVGFDY